MINYKLDSIKLYITELCPLDCEYCFVRSKKYKSMDFGIAKNLIDKLLLSKGDYKIIYLLGGEPFLEIDLIKKIINYSLNSNKLYNKKLNIVISTSGYIKLEKCFIDYLNINNIIISFSIDGTKNYHDRYRYLKNKKGTYNHILNNLKLFNNFNIDNLYGVITVYPDEDIVKNLFKSYLNLNKNLGFNSIHISNVQSISWNLYLQKEYLINLDKILKYIYYNYVNGKYIFLSGFSRFLVSDIISENNDGCFLKMLEVHTNGDIGHSMWSHYFYDDYRYIDGNFKNIDNILKLCTNNNECFCKKNKEYKIGENIIPNGLSIIYRKYEKIFGDDYKKVIIKKNKFI